MNVPTPEYDTWTDRALLDEFVRTRDEEAFRAIARRYWQLVHSVCRRVLHDEHAADDAFQNTFVILARNAHGIRRRSSLSSWLHGVALRTAIRAATRRQRRREVELCEDVMQPDDVYAEVASRHTMRLFDEELRQLPEKYRAPMVLFYVNGKSRSEIATSLGMSVTVLKGRLQRGRRTLRMRLAARGIQLSVAAIILHETLSATPVIASEYFVDIAMAVPRVAHPLSTESLETAASPLQTGVLTMRTWVSTGIAIATSTVLLTFCFGQQLTKAADPARPTLPLTTPTVELNRDHQAPVVYVAAAIPQSDEAEDSAAQSDKAETSLKYGDNRPDGKKSLGGTGEMIKFTLPNSSQKVRGLRIHAARYGTPQAPNEDVEITFENEARDEVVGTREVAYGKFRRGTSRWVTINFDEPVEVPSMFWVTLDFDAGRTKGVYVSYDTASGGEYSKMGLPGADAKPVDFGGDWMIQALLTKPM